MAAAAAGRGAAADEDDGKDLAALPFPPNPRRIPRGGKAAEEPHRCAIQRRVAAAHG